MQLSGHLWSKQALTWQRHILPYENNCKVNTWYNTWLSRLRLGLRWAHSKFSDAPMIEQHCSYTDCFSFRFLHWGEAFLFLNAVCVRACVCVFSHFSMHVDLWPFGLPILNTPVFRDDRAIQSSPEGLTLYSACSVAAKTRSDIWAEKSIEMMTSAPNPLIDR